MLMKIGEITSKFGISHRSLHYWEDVGIIKSSRAENDYRYYDEENQQKIRQILVLRKLRLPLKQIIMVLASDNTVEIIDTLHQNLNEVDDEITALSTIRSILDSFITKLNKNMMIDLKVNLLDDSTILEIADSLTVTRPTLKEEKTVEVLAKADEKLSKLTDRDVRIIYLPPATVASAHYIGDGPEGPSDDMIKKFVEETNLEKIYPASRHYGFNHPNPGMREDGKYGYERWMTIPADMIVPEPLEKKYFSGGLYATYMILPDDLNGTGWNRLLEWAFNNKYWQPFTDDTGNLAGSGEIMFDLLEEHLNYFNWLENNTFQQIDLLLPIKKRDGNL